MRSAARPGAAGGGAAAGGALGAAAGSRGFHQRYGGGHAGGLRGAAGGPGSSRPGDRALCPLSSMTGPGEAARRLSAVTGLGVSSRPP